MWRFGLWLSVAWALIVWIFGEGLGQLATGSVTFYMGAPGSAILYFILALFLLYGEGKPFVLKKLPATAGMLFIGTAALNLAPMFFQPTILSMLASNPKVSDLLGTLGSEGTTTGNILSIAALSAKSMPLRTATSVSVALSGYIKICC